jgi:hypothetical protein
MNCFSRTSNPLQSTGHCDNPPEKTVAAHHPPSKAAPYFVQPMFFLHGIVVVCSLLQMDFGRPR